MLFTHDTDATLRFAARLVNTSVSTSEGVEERLTDQVALDALLAPDVWTGARARDRRELEQVRDLRARLRPLWGAAESDAVVLVNELLTECDVRPQLVDHDDYGWHVHASSPEAPLPTRMAVDVALALVDVIRAGELDRLKTCDSEDCARVMVDLSRNRSKRYCDGTCGNRENVRAYRQRHTS